MTDFQTRAFLSSFRSETHPEIYLDSIPPSRIIADWCCKAHRWHQCQFTYEMGGKADSATPGICRCGTNLLNLPLEIDKAEYHWLPTFCKNGPYVDCLEWPVPGRIIDAESDTTSDCSSSGPACHDVVSNLSLDVLVAQDPLLPTGPEYTYGIPDFTGLYTLPMSNDPQLPPAFPQPAFPVEAPAAMQIDPLTINPAVVWSGDSLPTSHPARQSTDIVARALPSTFPMSSPPSYSSYIPPITTADVPTPNIASPPASRDFGTESTLCEVLGSMTIHPTTGDSVRQTPDTISPSALHSIYYMSNTLSSLPDNELVPASLVRTSGKPYHPSAHTPLPMVENAQGAGPSVRTRRPRHRAHPYDTRGPVSALFSSSPRSSPPSSRKTSNASAELVISKRRNARVTPSQAPAETQAAGTSADPWKCPHCSHVQNNQRHADFERHIETHVRVDGLWVCCGVPEADAHKFGLTGEKLLKAEVFEFNGEFLVGGCRKTFSRPDSLKRHLVNRKGLCFGGAAGDRQPGKKEMNERRAVWGGGK